MKTSPITTVVLAVASTLATVATIEFLRASPLDSKPVVAVEPAPRIPSKAVAEAEPLVPVVHALVTPTGLEDRLFELERRVTALEAEEAQQRAPITSDETELPTQEGLRVLVLDLVAQERAAQRRAEELEKEEEQLDELEFRARHQALMLAQEHDLPDWQREKFAELFLVIGVRTQEIEENIDLATDNPEDVEARWTEFDEWVDRLERDLTSQLDPALYYKIYGDD